MAFAVSPFRLARPSRHRRCPPTHSRRPRAGADQPLSSHSLDALLTKLHAHPPPPTASPPPVHLVGVGPGDPGLLTLAALRHMQRADVVLYDRLVSPEILSLVSPSATMVYVGKAAGFHTRTQHEIHLLLRFFAGSGARVVRLKGGDPLVFGRGGEEMAHLAAHAVPARAVPGITAAAGIAADLALPLTLRGVARSVTFLTGHTREGAPPELAHVDRETTYVVYMGLAQLPRLVDEFVARGLPPDTPAVAVERGTTPAQRALAAPLDRLFPGVERAAFESPTLIFVGEVVRFARVWGAPGVVEGTAEPPAAPADVLADHRHALDRAFEIIDRHVL